MGDRSSAADPEHARAALGTGPLRGGLAVLHGDLLGVLDLDLFLVLDAIRLSHISSFPGTTPGSLARFAVLCLESALLVPPYQDAILDTQSEGRQCNASAARMASSISASRRKASSPVSMQAASARCFSSP